MAEWSKAMVLGTSHFDGVGSNPTAAIHFTCNFACSKLLNPLSTSLSVTFGLNYCTSK